MIIQCDFDGTITTNNISVIIRERFAPSEWRKMEEDYFNGKFTVEQSNIAQYRLVTETKDTLVEYVMKNFKLRPGFLEFVGYCRANDIRFVVVSSGLDFYIEAVLSSIGITDMEVHCARTSFSEDGIAVTYTDPEGNIMDRDFKKKYLTWLSSQDRPVVYLGDGLSDVGAASAADYVFTCGYLHKLLDDSAVSHYQFTDFGEITQQLGDLKEKP